MTAALRDVPLPPAGGDAPASPVLDLHALPFDSLTRVRSRIPRALCLPHHGRAALALALGAAVMAGSLALSWLAFAGAAEQPWLYAAWPLCWLIGGIAFTSSFVLGHDCGHNSLLRSRRGMVALGHLLLLPGLYPFWAWKYSHDAHHQHTNSLVGADGIYYDNAWIPLTEALYKRMKTSTPFLWRVYRISRWCPPLGSFFHLALYHYRPSLFREGAHRRNVTLSIAFIALALVGVTAGLVAAFGPLWGVVGLVHFWLAPAFFLHVWMATYTFLHHTAEDTAFFEKRQWTPFKGQMENTINVYFPRVISLVHFNIDVHVPHHILQTIPSYHLRAANAALKDSEYGPHIRERRFSLRYYAQQVRSCQLWDRKREAYRPFAGKA